MSLHERAYFVLWLVKGAALAMLAGCSSMTQPEDIAIAEELCSKRGGFTHVARHQRGKNLVINCKDGTHVDVLLPEGPNAR